MTPHRFRLRHAVPGDRAALGAICRATALPPQPGADPDLLPAVYVDPYLAFDPGYALVMEDGDGPCGYALAAFDTGAFEERCEREWWPPLRERWPAPDEARRAAWSADEQLAAVVHAPHRAPADVRRLYPSHLHVDLLPHAQGQGWGRRLLVRLFDLLARDGSHGVHLGVARRNEGAQRFYARLGFATVQEHPGALLMARPLPYEAATPRGL